MSNPVQHDFLTKLALDLDRRLRSHSLIDIPRGWNWKVYWFSVHIHVALTSVLLVLGVSCFCTGVQQSYLYQFVNCSDGVSIAAPMANIFVVYFSLVAIKQQNDYWAAFQQFVITVTVFLMNIFFFVNQLLMGFRWAYERPRFQQNWPLHFATVDFLIAGVLLLIEVTCAATIVEYVLLITNWASWQQQAQRNIARSRENRDLIAQNLQ
ncbi:unnamed protein product [Bursaphelenchus okinawaensis]|uniref:Uncharacterized protein n=1 Tax=Bursaphelenchus okinawaensis TaxID=465554 RepID=A0A811LPD0_9BILA|nr:unnamed protein product [Bursaphelenchus okinawaensis]CAG9125537.1 unnamed protein product [Bursaphelenchus okinawaensis]